MNKEKDKNLDIDTLANFIFFWLINCGNCQNCVPEKCTECAVKFEEMSAKFPSLAEYQ